MAVNYRTVDLFGVIHVLIPVVFQSSELMFVVDFIKFSCLGLIIPKRNVELDFSNFSLKLQTMILTYI